jgi:hypothetical protein
MSSSFISCWLILSKLPTNAFHNVRSNKLGVESNLHPFDGMKWIMNCVYSTGHFPMYKHINLNFLK